MSASLARPSIAGAARRTRSAPSCSPARSLRLAFGITATVSTLACSPCADAQGQREAFMANKKPGRGRVWVSQARSLGLVAGGEGPRSLRAEGGLRSRRRRSSGSRGRRGGLRSRLLRSRLLRSRLLRRLFRSGLLRSLFRSRLLRSRLLGRGLLRDLLRCGLLRRSLLRCSLLRCRLLRRGLLRRRLLGGGLLHHRLLGGGLLGRSLLRGSLLGRSLLCRSFLRRGFLRSCHINLLDQVAKSTVLLEQHGDSPPDGLPLGLRPSGPPRCGERGCEPRAPILLAGTSRFANLDLSHEDRRRQLRPPSIPRQCATRLVLDDARLEKVSLLLQVDHFAHPRERVLLVREERFQPDLRGTPVGDVAQVALEHRSVEAEHAARHGVFGVAVLELDGLLE